MAIGAEHRALRELGDDSLPTPVDAVLAVTCDDERDGIRARRSHSCASASKRAGDPPKLPSPNSLGGWVAMVEFQCRYAHRVATVHTCAAASDQLRLPPAPLLLLHRYVLAFRWRRLCSKSSSAVAIRVASSMCRACRTRNRPGKGDGDTSNAHAHRSLLRVKGAQHDSHTLSRMGRETARQALRRNRCGRHKRQRCLPRRSRRTTSITGLITREVPHRTQTWMDRTLVR